MSSSKVLNNLNIRKYPSYESYKASTPDPDDLCVVDENGDLLLQVTTLPTASAAYESRIVQLKTNGIFYKCVSDGQDPATYSWVEQKVQGTFSTTATLAAADWVSGEQTVTGVSGVTSSNIVFVSPAPTSASDYASAGVLCTAQGTESLTFTCTSTPANDITVNVVCF